MTTPEPFTLTRRDAELTGWAAMYAVSELNLIRTTGHGAAAYTKLQFCFSGPAYRAVIENSSPRAVRELTDGYHANFHHPVLYAKALRLGASRLSELVPMSRTTRALLSVGPAAAATADITENVVNMWMHRDATRITDTTASVSSTLSAVKWAGTLGPLFYMTAGFVPVWMRWARSPFVRR